MQQGKSSRVTQFSFFNLQLAISNLQVFDDLQLFSSALQNSQILPIE